MTTTRGSSRPPGRHDSRRPSRSAVLAARRGVNDRRPHYWFAYRLLLVLSGQRPVHTLLGHTSGTAYEHLARLAPLAPLRPDPAVQPSPMPVLGHVGCSAPRPGAVEAYARIIAGDRTRAVAFRLEYGPDRRWRCVAVELDINLDPQPAT